MNKTRLINEFISAVEYMKETKFNGTYHWILREDNKRNNWAIVLGWADGFDKREADEYTDGTWRLCTKLAYQPSNSMMQCDYDVDWLMPYDEESGDVDDNEVSIYPYTNLKKVIDWLLECNARYLEAVEMCPHCDNENVFAGWDVNIKGYIAICKHCGKEIMLCDECMNAEDNEGMSCDWCPTECGGKCWRGTTKN